MIKSFKPALIAFMLVFAVAFLVPAVLFPATAAAAVDVNTLSASDVGDDYATLNGEVADDDNLDIDEFGFYYGTDEDEVTDGEDGSADVEEADGDYDDFYLELEDLDSNETYYFMAYAIDEDGDTTYGSVRSFDTDESSSGSDVEVQTNSASDIGADYATLNGEVTDDNGLDIEEFGFYYGTDKDEVADGEDGDADSEEADGDADDFSLELEDLDQDETYYFMAYAIDEDDEIAYGSVKSFTTKAGVSGTPSIFTLGSNIYNLRGATQVMDVAPYAKNNRTYLPVRYVAYTMGLTDDQIRWNALVPNTVTLTNGTTTVILNIGSPIMYKNGVPMMMDVAPEVSNFRTCLPIAWVAQAFGYTATWDGALKVTISGGATAGTGKVSLDDDSITLEPGDDETITGTLDAGGREIDDVDYEVDGDEVVSVDIDINGNEFDATIEVDNDADDGDECTITFTVTDEDGNEYEVELDVSVEDSGGDVEVSTRSASSIGDEYATLNGEITDDNGLDIEEFGFYYGTDEDDVADGEDGDAEVDEAEGDEDDFYLDLEGLESGETYYFMAYAIDEDDNISYGSVRSFETE